jgi:uncharacterized damage-inducible protein DinB
MPQTGLPDHAGSALRDALLEQLRRTHAGDPWYGASRTHLLHGVTAAEAEQRPLGSAHSIWELVLHMTAWTDEVARRLGGAAPAEPAAGDWPRVPRARGEAAWEAAKAALLAAHGRVLAALAVCPAERLPQPVGTTESPALGTGMSYRAMVRGLAQHHAYHGGQVAILKRAVESAE